MGNDLLQKTLEEVFEWFHRYPELPDEEVKTTDQIRTLLQNRNIEILDAPLNTGLVGIIRGKKAKPVVTIRCDIDALPIHEETTLDYKSCTANKMHACGHDFHITSIIGAAYLLKEIEHELEGTVKLLFQPAEESSHGAEKVIASKVLEDVDAIFGLHVIPNIETGRIGVIAGNGTAAVDRFIIEVEGIGCHAAHPNEGIDPIVVSCQIVTALQTIISRNINPLDQALISVTSIHGGNTWNVIASSAQLEGTVRTLNHKTRDYLHKRMKDLSENIGKAFGAKITFQWFPGPPATNNDPAWVAFASDVARNQGLKVVTIIPTLAGEDFAYYQENIKGALISIGIGATYPLHNSRFAVDKGALIHSAKLFSALARHALIKLSTEI
jgi:amidohydrolase